jgi:hypothetical protein
MSQPPSKQTQQNIADNAITRSEEEKMEASEGFKDEPPDQYGFFDSSSIDLDAFATSSLQAAAAAAVLAVQQNQTLPVGISPSEGMQHQLASMSSSQSALQGAQPNLSRSSSTGRPSLSGGEGSTSKEKVHHSERHMWTLDETQALVDGCNKHGVGNWKAIISDKAIAVRFNNRTAGDLKDRFRTYYPDAYHELYPNAKTHTSRAVRSKLPDGKSIFEKGKTKERRPFTPAEDDVLHKGYQQFGSHWAVIAKDPIFEGRRKSTDLRDRFRNAFPSLYEQAGYKPRAKSQKKERRPSVGSFSRVDQPSGTQINLQADALQRPALQPRSETSASAHSQAVSEHSELSEEEYSSDAIDKYKDRSDSIRSSISRPQIDPRLHSAAMPSLERSLSRSSSRSDQVPGSDGTRSPPSGLSTNAPSKLPAVLRRSQSTKRANLKIGSLDQAVKTAYTKSSKEAVIASHQQQHNMQQQQLQNRMPPVHDGPSVAMQRPALNQSVSMGWPTRFSWMPGGTSEPANLSTMDLDQMDEMINSHSASELLSGDESGSVASQVATSSSNAADEAMSLDEVQTTSSSNQTDFASLVYQQLALAGSSDNIANRAALSIESIQDLLDPVLPLQNTGQIGGWDQAPSTAPWTPVSSANAALSNENSFQTSANSATRREHEHNQWAGDLLHRGSYTNQEVHQQQQQTTSQGFVSMASMHLSTSNQGIPTSRSADGALGQPSSRYDFTLGRPVIAEQVERPALRPNEHGAYSTPSVHELISRSARRQSYPPRPVGLGDDGDDMMQSAYSNPYPYPADDISLLNSSAGGSLTLFPSLVNSQVNDYGQMRRRRSTDTLREGAYNSFAQPWRGGLLDSARPVEEQDEMAKTGSISGQREAAVSASSRHGTSDHSRSISDSHTNGDDDDEDAPSRAASVGNMDLVGQRDNVLYAESLPDLTSGIDEHSAFSQHHNLQISYDDMDLPSFLNRSPSFLHATTASATTSFGVRPGSANEQQRSSSKAWSASAVAHSTSMDQTQASSKGPSKSVDWTNLSDFGSLPLTAWDRLEHLYLEAGTQGMSPSTGYGGNTSANRRYPTNNAWYSSGTNDRAGGGTGGGGNDAGYESV